MAELADHIWHLTRDNNRKRSGAITFSCLGKLRPAGIKDLNRWAFHLRGLVHQALEASAAKENLLVVGLAESGIVPSALFHRILAQSGISSRWICSTRRPAKGIRFTESHSHAPDHILPLPDQMPSEIWFVEDEITTGRTLLKLSTALCRRLNVKQARFFALTDHRSRDLCRRFEETLLEQKISHTLQTLFQLPPLPASPASEEERSSLSSGLIPGEDEAGAGDRGSETGQIDAGWHFPEHRPALQDLEKVWFPRMLRGLSGTLLVVGEAMDLALSIVEKNPDLHFTHVTLSPWKVDGEHIRNRTDFNGRYFLYNLHRLKKPLYLLYDPIDRNVARTVEETLAPKGFPVRRLVWE